MWTLFCWFTGVLVFYVPFYTMTNIANISGKTDGLWSAGVGSFSVVIFVHHFMIFVGTRNFTWILSFMYLFSFMMFMPLVIWLND
jgi:hypothetical protein